MLAAIDGLPGWERTHTRLLTRAGEWDAKGHDRSLLLRGSELRDAERWSAERPEGRQPTQLELSYLLASRKASTRRLRTLVVVALVALAVTVALGIVALLQRNEATRQRNAAVRESHLALSRALAADSTGAAGSRLDLSALLALEAYRTAPTAAARDALVTAVERADRVKAILPGTFNAIASGGGTLATLTGEGTVRLWDLGSAHARGRTIVTPDVISTLALAADGHTLATGGGFGITLWDARTGRPLGRRFSSGPDVLAFSPAGTILASADPYRFRHANVGPHPRARGLRGQPAYPPRLAFSPRGGELAGLGNRRIYRWRVRDWHALRPIDTGKQQSSFAFAPNATTLASTDAPAHHGRWVRLWHLPQGHRFRRFHVRGQISTIAFEDARTLLAVDGGRIELLDLGRRAARFQPLSLHERGIADLVPGRAGTFASRSDDGTVRLWSLAPRGAVGLNIDRHAHAGVAVSPNGRTLAAIEPGGSVGLWNTATRRPVGPPIPSRGVPVSAIAFAGNRTVATGGEDGVVKLYDLRRPRRRPTPGRHGYFAQAAVTSLASTDDGRSIASVSNNSETIRIAKVARRPRWTDVTMPFGGGPSRVRAGTVPVQASGLAFAPDGRTLAAAIQPNGFANASLAFWDVRAPRRRPRRVGSWQQTASTLAFSPDGRLVAAGIGGTVRLWDVARRRALEGWFRVGSTISSLSFSPDGRTLAVGADNGLSLWDVASRTRLGQPLQAGGPVRTVAFAAHGKTLVSDSAGGVFLWNPILWSRRSGDFAGRLCQVADRNLTPSEWRQFLPGEPYRKTCG